MGSEANTLIVENGGSVNTNGANSSGIEIRPYQEVFGLALGQTPVASTATITIEQGGVVESQLGTGIKDDSTGQTTDFGSVPYTPVISEHENETNVIVAGTVVGGNGTAIDLESGDDRVELKSTAQITGDVFLRDGEDRFSFESGFTATGRIDGGNGDDIVEADVALGDTRSLDVASLPLDSFEVVEKTGEGSLTLLSTPSAGASVLRVNEGFADTGADLTNLDVEVYSGGTFFNDNLINDVTTFGTGVFVGTDVGGNLVNNGVTSPGGDGIIGNIDVAGDLTLGASGVLAIDIFADGSSDTMSVDGILTLGGTLAVNGVMFPMGFDDEATYAVLTSPGAVLGGFDSVTDNLPDVDAMVTILPPTGPSDPLDPNRPGTVVISYMRSDDGSDKAILSNAAQFGGQMGLVFVETLQRRARLQGPCCGGEHGFWQEGIGASHRVSSSAVATGYRGSMGGYAAGVDRCVSASDGTLRYGIAGAYTGGGATSGTSTADIDGGQFGLYSSLNHTSGLLLSSALGYGFLDYDMDRGIPIGGSAPIVASGQTLGGVLALSLAGSYDLAPHLGFSPAQGFRFAPIVRFDYANARRSDYREGGAGMLNLNVGDTRFDSGLVSFGLEMGRTKWTAGGMRVSALYDIRYERVVGRQNTTSVATLASVGGDPFYAAGGVEQRDRVAIGTGVGVNVTKNVTIHGRYDTAFRNDVSSHRASGGATVRF